MSPITQLLADLSAGRDEALDRLFPLVYDDLRRIAHRHMQRERASHTLRTTDLVHESYLSLVDQSEAAWQDRAHFYATASRAMRHILIDYARRRQAQKRGGGRHRVELEDYMLMTDEEPVDLLALDEALTRLATLDERLERVVECRFFGGMTVEETAAALEVAPRTVRRDWVRAKTYLFQMLRDRPAPPDEA